MKFLKAFPQSLPIVILITLDSLDNVGMPLFKYLKYNTPINWQSVWDHVQLYAIILGLWVIGFWVIKRLRNPQSPATASGLSRNRLYLLIVCTFVIWMFCPFLLNIFWLKQPLITGNLFIQCAILTPIVPFLFFIYYIWNIYMQKSRYKIPTIQNPTFNVWDKGIHLITSPLFSIGFDGLLVFSVCLFFSFSQSTFLVSFIALSVYKLCFSIFWYKLIRRNFPL